LGKQHVRNSDIISARVIHISTIGHHTPPKIHAWIGENCGILNQQAVESLLLRHCGERFSRRGNLEFTDIFSYEIVEFIPSHKARLLRHWLAMTARDPSQRRLKDFFSNLLDVYLRHNIPGYFPRRPKEIFLKKHRIFLPNLFIL
jgi:hypothetical protein